VRIRGQCPLLALTDVRIRSADVRFEGQSRPRLEALQCPLLRSVTARFRGARLTINALISERLYFSSKHLIVRHKVVQQSETNLQPARQAGLSIYLSQPIRLACRLALPSILSNCWCVRRDFSASYSSRRATVCVAITVERFNCSTPLRPSLGIKLFMGPSLRTAHPPCIHDVPNARRSTRFVLFARASVRTN
jgi:hypothetical protein